MPSRYGVGRKAIREILSLDLEEAERLTGLPASLFDDIATGRISSLSSSEFNAFRRGLYQKSINIMLTEGNVSVKEARTIARNAPSIGILHNAAEQTTWGKNIDPAVNDATNLEIYKDDIDILKEQEKRLAKEKKCFDYFAKIIVNNNGFDKLWISERKKFINSDRIVRTKKDALELMKEIMALGRKDGQGWEGYVVERARKEQWVPTVTKYNKKRKSYERFQVPNDDPKYADYVRRVRSGKMMELDRICHDLIKDDLPMPRKKRKRRSGNDRGGRVR